MARISLVPRVIFGGETEDFLAEEFLPVPKAKRGKAIPHTVYTSKNFDTRSSVPSSQWLQKASDHGSAETPTPQNVKLVEFNKTGSVAEFEEEEHLPAGQHLLVDIDGVNAAFLNSEQQLATSMITLVDNSGLTLLSYHCHGLKPAGVTCVGVLLESHISFHTWPEEGVITLDLFTCGSNSLLNHLHLIERLFAIPEHGPNSEPPRVLWAYKRRGFKEQTKLTGQRDTFAYPLGVHGIEEKREVASTVTSSGKQAWIYDIEQPNNALEGEVNRLLYVDGVQKSNKLGEAAVHESFVHPAMFAHTNPSRVLLFGTGTGASIKEVLKHKNLQELVVLGADDKLLEFTKSHFPELTDCSSLQGIQENCLDDPRVTLVKADHTQWLAESSGSQFDVAFLDTFELEEESSSDMFADSEFLFGQLSRRLSDDGILVLQPLLDPHSVDSRIPKSSNRRERESNTVHTLLKSGFDETAQYEERNVGLFEARSYVVAFKNKQNACEWNENEAQVNKKLRQRSVPTTTSAKTPLRFFDGATMSAYNKHGALFNATYCRDWTLTKGKMDATLSNDNETRSSLEAFMSALSFDNQNSSVSDDEDEECKIEQDCAAKPMGVWAESTGDFKRSLNFNTEKEAEVLASL